MRTDQNNNPTAFTVDIAKEAQLVKGVDYELGTPFPPPSSLITARLLLDPVRTTIKVIDKIGFRTSSGNQRWVYINFPHFVWLSLNDATKMDIIGWMYQQEGGTVMRSLFPNYGKV